MLYILGILTGLLLAIIVFLAVRKYRTPIERTLKQVENKIKERGEVYIDTDEKLEYENFINNLPSEETLK